MKIVRIDTKLNEELHESCQKYIISGFTLFKAALNDVITITDGFGNISKYIINRMWVYNLNYKSCQLAANFR